MADISTNRPRFESRVSLGNILTIGVLIASIAGGWYVMNERSQSNQIAINKMETEINTRFRALETRTRMIEVEQARSAEKFNSVMELLHKIDARLARIETSTRN